MLVLSRSNLSERAFQEFQMRDRAI
jgi:hypothetical protein